MSHSRTQVRKERELKIAHASSEVPGRRDKEEKYGEGKTRGESSILLIAHIDTQERTDKYSRD